MATVNVLKCKHLKNEAKMHFTSLAPNMSGGVLSSFVVDNGHPYLLPHFKHEWGVLVFFSGQQWPPPSPPSLQM
jgi:hypothetical protein